MRSKQKKRESARKHETTAAVRYFNINDPTKTRVSSVLYVYPGAVAVLSIGPRFVLCFPICSSRLDDVSNLVEEAHDNWGRLWVFK